MLTIDQKGRVTRRMFFERSAGALAAAGLLAGGADATEVAPDSGEKLDAAKPDSAPMPGKIALEEHFALPGSIDASYTSLPTPESRRQIQDLGSGRIAEMDRGGVELCILSGSGAFRTQALTDLIREVGADRVLYSVDYPYDDMGEATEWFDNTPISEPDRLKIAHGNARQLFRL